MKVAVTLGYPPHVVKSWPHSDIIKLAAYDQIEPYGSMRDNWHMAVIAQLFCAANTRRGRKPPDLKSFFYQDPTSTREQNAKTFTSFLRAKAKK